MAQRKRVGLITQRSEDRNLPPLFYETFFLFFTREDENLVFNRQLTVAQLVERRTVNG